MDLYNDQLQISGFSDEISSDFITQLQAVRGLDMNYLSLRGIDGRNIGDYTLEEIQESVLPKLHEYGVAVSSIGSPIGKIFITDDEGFTQQLTLLDRLCKIANLLNCQYIRIFSFYIPKGDNADQYYNKVISQISQFTAIAAKYNVILLHENEKDIFGDIARRCNEMLEAVQSPHFKAIFDFANFVQCGEDTWECYQLLTPHIAYIHIKDAVSTSQQNVVCGTGEGKIRTILADLIANGYEGFLTLEPHLVLFDSLSDLELEAAEHIIKDDKGITGEEAYALQFHALVELLYSIESEAMSND